jgi:hypothetical protein
MKPVVRSAGVGRDDSGLRGCIVGARVNGSELPYPQPPRLQLNFLVAHSSGKNTGPHVPGAGDSPPPGCANWKPHVAMLLSPPCLVALQPMSPDTTEKRRQSTCSH